MWPLVGKPHARASLTLEIAGKQTLDLMGKENKSEKDNMEEEDGEGDVERVIMGVVGRR